ncbi:MAG: hypothetical protein ACK4MX_05345 [Thermaurantiacus sp.]
MIRRPRLSRRAHQRPPSPNTKVRDAGRRSGWAATAMLVAGTLAVAVTGYSLSVAVSDERREVRRLEARTAELHDLNRALEAELRVRMRLPQLQSWNDGVLGLLPITAEQHVGVPRALARFAMPVARPQSAPTLALMTREVAPQPQPTLVSAPDALGAPVPRRPGSAASDASLPPGNRPAHTPPPAPRAPAAPLSGPTLASGQAPKLPSGALLPPPLPSDLLRLVELEPGAPAP